MTESKSDKAFDEYLKRPWAKWYGDGASPDIKVPETNIVEAVDESCKKWGDKVALIFYGKKIKHKEIREYSLRFATALHDLGIKKGDVVAIYLPNCPQFVIAYHGILRLGATVTTVSPLYTPREIAYQLRDSRARAIVCVDLHYEKVKKALEEVKMDHVIITSMSEYLPGSDGLRGRLRGKSLKDEIRKEEGLLQFSALLEKYPPNPPSVQISPDDIAALPYTGGTTGDPKGAVLTHRNIVAIQEQMRQFFAEIEDGKESALAVLPFYHIYGQSVIMLTGAFRGGSGSCSPHLN